MSSVRAMIVSGSPRRQGNTVWLSQLVADTLHKRDVRVSIEPVTKMKSLNNGCIGCQGCQKSKEYLCVFKDDVQPLVAAFPSYQYVIFASPVYFYGPSAQLKLVIDRMYSLIKIGKEDGKYRHPFPKNMKFGLLGTAGGDANDGADLMIDVFKRIADSFERPLETLVIPEAPYLPDEIENPGLWETQATEFCDRLLA